MIHCGQCGSRLIVSNAKNRHGNVYCYFVCSGRHSKRTDCTRQAMLIDDALGLLANCADIYGYCDDTNRRLCNQAFFTKVYIDEDNELRVEHNRPFEMLLDPQVNANAPTWAADADKARTSTNIDVGKGSSLVCWVDLSTAGAEKWGPLLELPRGSLEPRSAPDYEGVVAIRQRQRRLTADEVKQVAERYIAGATVYELAAEFGCHRATIAERLKLAGVTMRHQPTAIEQVDEILRLYESGLSMVKVAEQVGVSARTVLNYLQERGVSTRDAHGRPKPLPGTESPECGLN